MDELLGSGDPGVDAFVDVNLCSFAAWDVAVYLEQNAAASADVGELCSRLGRKEHEIEGVLNDFVERGIACAAAESDGRLRYSLTPDPSVRRVLTRFVELAKVRVQRLEFVRRVLAGMARA